jgi:hypothetical protein
MILIAPVAVSDTGAFSRASTASFYTVDGRLGVAPVNVPRLNYPPEKRTYAPAGWLAGPSLLLPTIPLPGMSIVPAAPPQFLAEAAGTNVMLQSQDLTTWTASDATIHANVSTAPDGTATSDLIRPTTTDTADHQAAKMGSAAVVAAGGVVGASIFLRAAGHATARFRCAPAGEAAGFEMIANLVTGDIPAAGSFGAGASFVNARLIALAAGWYRLELEGAVAGATTFGLTLTVGNGVTSFEGDEIAGVEAWGADLKAGLVTSYVATGATAVARAADVGTPMLVSSVEENEPVWLVGDTYAEDDIVRGAGDLAHKIFLSLKGPNIGHALTDTEWWLEAGSTNRWRMFDDVIGSQTADADSISVVITAPKRITALALMNIDAAAMRVTVTDAAEGIVYDREVSLIGTNGINNWWSWFFADIQRVTQKVLLDLPPYSGAQITITLSNPGNTVRCGACVIGQGRDIGITLEKPQIGNQDYSRKDRDSFGNAKIAKRPFSRRASFDVLVDNSAIDGVVDLLDGYRATPVVYLGSERYGSTVVFGFYNDYAVVIASAQDSRLNIQVESLV